MSAVNTSTVSDGPLSARGAHHQNAPWLIRAGYFHGELGMARLILPGPEEPLTRNTTHFSRHFLSKYLGGSQYLAYTKVKLDRNHVYHLADYYVSQQEWNPQYPKNTGEHGALLVVGKYFENPPVPWGTIQRTSSIGHRETSKTINCFIERSSAEYEYLGCYVIHSEFRKLTDAEVEQHVPKATKDLWENGIDSTQWGAKLKSKHESKKAEELFKLLDGDTHKLCWYWQYIEYIGYNRSLYQALCVKGEQFGWTTRKPCISEGSGVTECKETESATEKEEDETPPTSSEEEA